MFYSEQVFGRHRYETFLGFPLQPPLISPLTPKLYYSVASLRPQSSPQPHQTPKCFDRIFCLDCDTRCPDTSASPHQCGCVFFFFSCPPFSLHQPPPSSSLSSLICVSISHGGSVPIPLHCSPLCLRTHKCRGKHASNFKPLLSASFYDYSLPFPNSLSFSFSPHLPPSGSRDASNGFFWQI